MKALIVSGGKTNPSFVLELLKKEEFHKIIAVDNGLAVLDVIDLLPTDIIGDFDTVSPELLQKYKDKNGISIHTYPSKKDATDSQLALELAMIEADSIVLLGATGTRLDHVLGAIYMLQIPLERGIDCCILDENNSIRLINKPKTIRKKESLGKYVSLLPLTDTVKGITLKGFKYPLENYNMESGKSSTIGISNELVNEEGFIDFKEGILILIESRD